MFVSTGESGRKFERSVPASAKKLVISMKNKRREGIVNESINQVVDGWILSFIIIIIMLYGRKRSDKDEIVILDDGGNIVAKMLNINEVYQVNLNLLKKWK